MTMPDNSPDPIEQLYIESSAIGLVEFRRRIQALVIQERIDERTKYKSLLENVVDLFPNDNDWAIGRKQGIKDCIADQTERIAELKDKQEKKR